MRNFLVITVLVFAFIPLTAQKGEVEVLSKEIQIKTALLAVPDDKKDGAMIYGYDKEGKIVVLRDGTNDMVCIADNPNNKGIQVSCYFIALEPFMQRGRELKAVGKNTKELREVRGIEVSKGLLKMPKEPTMLYVYFGSEDNYDKNTGELKDGKFRYVIYTPFATTESTGLPDKPHAPGMPWLMDPGTHRAHIMVGPN